VILKTMVPLVIDADGINLLVKDPSVLKEKQTPVILTPHIQEMSRLTDLPKQELIEHGMEIAVKFTEEYPVTLVLKNARTIVAKNGGQLYLNSSGNSGMATGGSGDVLAGIIGGLLVQGMKEKEAADLGVFLHGKAGDAAEKKKSEYSMTATDLLEGIAEVTRI
jgi:NAD(P)H-hydrate epimerase